MVSDESDHIKDQIDKIIEKTDSKQESSAVQQLSQTQEEIQLEQKEERFIWILVIIVFFDILFLKDCNNWSLPWIVGIIELMVIWILADKFDIKPIKVLITMFYEAIKGK